MQRMRVRFAIVAGKRVQRSKKWRRAAGTAARKLQATCCYRSANVRCIARCWAVGGDDVDVDGGHEEAHGGAGEPRGAALHDVARLQPPRCSGKDKDAVHSAHPALAKNSKGVVHNRECVVRPALGQLARESGRVPQMDDVPDAALHLLHGVLLDLCGAVEISTVHGRKVSVAAHPGCSKAKQHIQGARQCSFMNLRLH